jgi:type VI protein secretion system component VasK
VKMDVISDLILLIWVIFVTWLLWQMKKMHDKEDNDEDIKWDEYDEQEYKKSGQFRIIRKELDRDREGEENTQT